MAASWLALLACMVGCQGPPSTGLPTDVPPSAATTALFSLEQAASDLYAIPYPSDIRARADGTIDLAGLEQRHQGLVRLCLETVIANPNRGFSTAAAMHLRFDGPVDTASLPATAKDTLQPGASLFLVNIDATSPEYGQRTPVRWRYTAEAQKHIGSHSLAVLPARGFVLAPDTTHALVVTERLVDLEGEPVQPSADFRLLLDDAPPGAPELLRAHEAHAPLRSYLRDIGADEVVTAAVFTTGRPTELAGLARQVVHELPAPVARDLVVTDEPSTHFVVEGTYAAPNFQTGSPPYIRPADGGAFALDPTGRPMVQRTETLRFALSVPRGPMPPNGWPVVIYAHGTGGSYRTFINSGVARKLSEVRDNSGAVVARLAVAGIDQVLHGPRAPQGTSPELTFFNLQNPLGSVHNVIQAGVDDFSLLRMLEGLSFGAVDRAGDATGEEPLEFDPPLRLDPQRVFFMGHSQGGLTGPVFLAHEPAVRTAVLSMLEKSAPNPIKPLVTLALGEPPSEFHPVMALVQQMLDPAETANYGRHLVRSPVAGVGPKNVFLSQGFVDHYTPNSTTDSLAVTIGLPLAGTPIRAIENLGLSGLQTAALPLAGNLDAGGATRTGALLQYRAVPTALPCQQDSDCPRGDYCEVSQGRCADDGHYVVFRHQDAIRHYSLFLATAARDTVPTIVQ